MKLLYLYTELSVLKDLGYNPQRVAIIKRSVVNKPILLPNEKSYGHVCDYPLYTGEQLLKHLDYIQGYKTKVILKVVGEID